MAQNAPLPANVSLQIFTDRIFYSNQTELSVTTKLKASNTNLHGVTLRFNIHSDDGKNILSKDLEKLLLLSTTKFDIRSLPDNQYTLDTSLMSQTGDCLAKTSAVFHKVALLDEKIPRLRISKDGIPLLDGKPVLLHIVWLGGGWEGPIKKEELKAIKEQGFDAVIVGLNYMRTDALPHFDKYNKGKGGVRKVVERSNFKDFNQFLEALHEYEMTCFAHMGEITARFPELSSSNLEDAGKFIMKYRNAPAILGWYSFDETDAWLETNAKVYKVIKEADPFRPVWLNVIIGLESNKNACDIISTDPYPIGKTKITLVSSHMDNIVKSQYGLQGKSPWIILQMFGSPSENWPRPPTPEEEKCMSYIALNHGAKSLAYFAHQRIDTLPTSKKLTPELWQSMRSLNKETKEMSLPYLLGENLTGVHSGTPSLDIAVKRYKNSTFLIAVNTLPEELDDSIDLGTIKKEGKASVKFESRETSISNGIISDHFRPYDVHIYVIE